MYINKKYIKKCCNLYLLKIIFIERSKSLKVSIKHVKHWFAYRRKKVKLNKEIYTEEFF